MLCFPSLTSIKFITTLHSEVGQVLLWLSLNTLHFWPKSLQIIQTLITGNHTRPKGNTVADNVSTRHPFRRPPSPLHGQVQTVARRQG